MDAREQRKSSKLQIKAGSFQDGQLEREGWWESRGGECLALHEDHTALSSSSSELTLRESLAHGNQKHILIYLISMPVLWTDWKKKNSLKAFYKYKNRNIPIVCKFQIQMEEKQFPPGSPSPNLRYSSNILTDAKHFLRISQSSSLDSFRTAIATSSFALKSPLLNSW